jgi:hypothetical protein
MIFTYTLAGFLAGWALPELIWLHGGNFSIKIPTSFNILCGLVGAIIAHGIAS